MSTTELQPFQQRVVEEKETLDVKLKALDAFLSTDQCHALPLDERTRLLRQRTSMQSYSKTLGDRIEAWQSA